MKTTYVHFSKPSGPQIVMYLDTCKMMYVTLFEANSASDLKQLATDNKADLVMFQDTRFPRSAQTAQKVSDTKLFEKWERLHK